VGVTENEVPLTLGDYLRYRIVSERGRVIAFTVQYKAIIDGRTYPVVRYDTAQQMAHRDLLDAEGRNVDKLWFPGWPYAAALDYARKDILANRRQYREDFIGRML
jgi:hypothetical protein